MPEAWPIAYNDMAPYYEQAETLYRVHGTQDPLAPAGGELLAPSPASERELALFAALHGAGLNPYRIHSASERVPGCAGCSGMLCPVHAEMTLPEHVSTPLSRTGARRSCQVAELSGLKRKAGA